VSIFRRRARTQPPVVLFSKPDCSLCDDARAMLDAAGIAYEVAHNPAYDLRVPVIEVGGRVVTEGRVSERAVRSALRRGL
jgi:glutaredoxin